MRGCFFLPLLLVVSAQSVHADDVSYPMSSSDCMKTLRDTAQQLQIPLVFSVNTPDRKDFTIRTNEGVVVMRCQRVAEGDYDALLTVSSPGSSSVAPYVDEGFRRSK